MPEDVEARRNPQGRRRPQRRGRREPPQAQGRGASRGGSSGGGRRRGSRRGRSAGRSRSGLGRRVDHGLDLALGDDPRRLVRDDDGREDVADAQVADRDLLAVFHDRGVALHRVLIREHRFPCGPRTMMLWPETTRTLPDLISVTYTGVVVVVVVTVAVTCMAGLQISDADVLPVQLELETVRDRVLRRLAGRVRGDDLVAVHAVDDDMDDA